MILNAFVYARRYAGVVIAIALCLSVCLSVSVTSRCYSIETSGPIELFFRVEVFFDLFYTVLLANRGIYKSKDASIWNFVPSSGLKINLARKSRTLISTDAYTYSVMNWTVVGILS